MRSSTERDEIMVDKKMLLAYFRQQRDLSMPDVIFRSGDDVDALFGSENAHPADQIPFVSKASITAPSVPGSKSSLPDQKKTTPAKSADKQSISSRLSGLKTIEQLSPSIKPRQVNVKMPSGESSSAQSLTYNQKRDTLKELYYGSCTKCALSQTRRKFVFGAGSAGAQVMVIGEAPGADEDEQGIPFVGDAGQLLGSMLKAIKLDKKNDVFITNILKCRPPENLKSESPEIITCLPLLVRQIDIIKPQAILLLGRIAAHSLLGINDSIAKLRSQTHFYKNIPVMVIYHPAELLINPEYKRSAWEDLQKFQQILTDLGVYESAKI